MVEMVASTWTTRGQWRGAASPLKRDGSWTEKRSRREDDACPMDRRRGGEWHPQATHGSRSVSALSKSQRFGDSRQAPPMGDHTCWIDRCIDWTALRPAKGSVLRKLFGPHHATEYGFVLHLPGSPCLLGFRRSVPVENRKKATLMGWDGRERPTRPRERQQQQRTDTAAPSTEPLSPIRTPLLGSFLPFHLL